MMGRSIFPVVTTFNAKVPAKEGAGSLGKGAWDCVCPIAKEASKNMGKNCIMELKGSDSRECPIVKEFD